MTRLSNTKTQSKWSHISNDIIRAYSIPLILGVIVALIVANAAPHWYEYWIEEHLFFGKFTFAWFVENVFMVFFFGTAGIEIVHALSPGGALNPIKKAVTPLMATLGGVLGPAGLFLLLNHFFGHPDWSNGWGICTATDIALAWLFAKLVFGKDHPAVSFLLLLAVADDAIGLAIIAIFYPTPGQPIRPIFLLLVLAGMLVAFLFRKLKVKTYWPYILVAGILCWLGLFKTGVSPALSLVFVVPFLPNSKKEFEALEKFGKETTLTKFEHNVGPIVDYGLFFFGFSMAGVRFSVMSALTFIVMISLIVGKMFGISLFTFIFGHGFKFGLPKGMSNLDVIVAGIVGGTGLTVALFVTNAAYTDIAIQGAAKMGALFSVAAGIFAFLIHTIFRPIFAKADAEVVLEEEAYEKLHEGADNKEARVLRSKKHRPEPFGFGRFLIYKNGVPIVNLLS